MWKLTISQTEKVTYERDGEKNSYERENNIDFKTSSLGDLLMLVQDAERLHPVDTKYVIERVGE